MHKNLGSYILIQDSCSIFNFIFDEGSRSSVNSVDEYIYEPPIITSAKHIETEQNS